MSVFVTEHTEAIAMSAFESMTKVSTKLKWKFDFADRGFLRDYYKIQVKGKWLIYCWQWDNGFDNPPIWYRCTKTGEADYPTTPLEYIPPIPSEGQK